jgi:serine/threonine protein kinase
MANGIPEKFGKCKVEKLLGQGATAIVCLAKHEGLDIPVAVKVLRRKLSERRPEYAERFLREARFAARLEHPNIIRVIDCGVQDGYHYMVMDYVDGQNCLEKLQDQPQGLDWREATHIVRQAAAGLAYAAAKDIIHRDVKPSNIMIDKSGRARVSDLGLAKMTIKGMAELTQELHTVGTPNYMSPEQIRSPSGLDLRTDIYSLGASFYHMACGLTPFAGKTPMDVVAKHLSEKLVPPFKRKPTLPPPLSSIICKMMAKSPDERYQNYDELNADLENLLEGKRTTAESFRETRLAVEDEAELRQLLDELTFGTKLAVEDEQQTEDEAEAAQVEETGQIDPFGPGDFASFATPDTEKGDTTVLATQLLRRRRKSGGLIVGLAVAGLIIALIAAALIVLLLAR